MDLYRSKHSDKPTNRNSSSNDKPSRSFRNSGDRDDRGSRYSRDDRGGRDDRGSRYSRDDRGGRDDRGSRYSRDDRGGRDDRGSRYSRDDRNGGDREQTTVTCSDCNVECTVPFVPRSNKPVYCSDCFRKYKPDEPRDDRGGRDDRGSRYSRDDRGGRDDRGSRYSRDDRNGGDREQTTVTCSDCNVECTVPFVPRSNKPVYCSDCFRKYKPDEPRDDRGGRDDRGSRYSRDDRGGRDDRGSRYSRDDRNGGDREQTTVTCSDCNVECTVPFVPRSNKPVYCSDCFRKYKPDEPRDDRGGRDDRGSRYSRDDRGGRDDRGSRYSRDDRNGGDREQTTVTCSDCNVECTVPFVPRSNKPVYCSDCFRKYKPDEPRDDRGGRSSYGRDSSRSSSRPSRGKSDKFLRKQESFYSGGSAKFNESLQKKLYEILGGKKCSNCGSDDERSLGICDANNNQISADTGRGSSAGSWGKYISAPDAAKKELKVFCSNCNDSVKPAPKPRDDRPKSKRSKYFSR